MATAIVRKPDDFTGEKPEEFPIWLAKFNAIAVAGKWHEDEKKLAALPTYLTKQAFQVYDKLTANEKDMYAHLIAALQKKMGIDEKVFMWRVQLRRSEREAKETVDQYVIRLHNLARQAFPDATDEALNEHVNEAFVMGSPKRELQETDERLVNSKNFEK